MFDTPISDLERTSFLSVELVGGHPRLRINLGDGETMATVDARRLNDGKWHTLQIIKNGRVRSTELNRAVFWVVVFLRRAACGVASRRCPVCVEGTH